MQLTVVTIAGIKSAFVGNTLASKHCHQSAIVSEAGFSASNYNEFNPQFTDGCHMTLYMYMYIMHHGFTPDGASS